MNPINISLEHASLVQSLAKDPGDIRSELTRMNTHLMHMALGIAGEAGEVVDVIKKSVIYGKPLDQEKLIEELGDLEFYLQGLRSELGILRGAILQANVDKLRKRYGTAYSDSAAISRADKSDYPPAP